MTHKINNDGRDAGLVRCASYARYSSDVQRPTSIDDQVRNCRDAAVEHEWIFLPEFAHSDQGISGAALITREGLNRLIAEAKKDPRPFDCVLIDDTSRLGRNLSDVLKVADILRHRDIFLYFVTQDLDSRDPSFRIRLIMYGMQDEDFLVGLRHRVHRGMKGAALADHHTGGTRYGYRNVLIEDPNRKDEHGRPAIAYTILEIDPNESAVVRDIFERTATGESFVSITKHLNALNVPAPRGSGWSYTTVKRIVRDELFIGKVIWGKTKNDRDPESGKIRKRRRPREEWVTREHPQLRIISQDLWDRVQEQIRQNERIGKQRLGGFNKTKQSQGYLFSGLLECGLCAGAMGIIKGGKVPATYGCRRHRFENRCANAATIRRDSLEEQLLGAIQEKLRPEILDDSLTRLRAEITNYLDKEVNRGTASDKASLESRLGELKTQETNLARAIARKGDSEALMSELTAVSSEIAAIKGKIAVLSKAENTEKGTVSFEKFRGFVREKAGSLDAVLKSDPTIARETLRKVITRLVLTPVQTADGPRFDVTGDIDLFAGESDVMLGYPVEHSAKHYTPLLSLNGLQLDPRRAVSSFVPSGQDNMPPMSLGTRALPIQESTLV